MSGDDFGDWFDDYYKSKKSEDWDDAYYPCRHEWAPVLLLITTVYDCKKCGMKKEYYDKEVQSRR